MDDAAETQNRSATDWVADLCLYAPIGFLLDAHNYLPQMAEKGRSQVAVARFLGQFAVGRVSKQIAPLLDTVAVPLKVLCDGLGLNLPDSLRPDQTADTAAARTAPDGTAPPPSPAPAVDNGAPSQVPPGEGLSGAGSEDDPYDVPPPAEDELAIPGYATLAASQVVPRLASLSVHELASIRRYEAAHRRRRTILNRVDQLLARAS